jgi:3-methyladenine DNA glycosylase/8-oxoguanine DNA glycosylase
MSEFPVTFKIPDLSPVEFRTILRSHYWFDLPPFDANPEEPRLSLAFNTPGGSGEFEASVQDGECLLQVESGDPEHVKEVARTCLSLDLDVSTIYDKVSGHEEYGWITERKFGRYLRSPTLFEDCYKIIATTNMHWKGTKNIVKRTVDKFGTDVNGKRAFPLPYQILEISEEELSRQTRCGYRAKSFLDLSQKAAADPDFFLGDAWKRMDSKEFFEKVRSVSGLGSMSASYLCRFYGKPHDYSLDSWIMKRCGEIWGITFKNGRGKYKQREYPEWAKDKYDCFAPFGPSVFWFEITKYWHESEKMPEEWQ